MDVRDIRGLYGIADADFRPELPLSAKVAAFLEGGSRVIQLRMKSRPARELYEAALEARAQLRGRVLLLVNDRPDVALAAGADGVHVGAEDLPVDVVRRIVGPRMILGATARTFEGARRAVAAGADYVGFGPVFTTTTKSIPVPERGLSLLAEVAAGLGAPVVAIGGIDLARAAAVAKAGAAAAAVISDVLGAADPVAQAKAFMRAFEEGRGA